MDRFILKRKRDSLVLNNMAEDEETPSCSTPKKGREPNKKFNTVENIITGVQEKETLCSFKPHGSKNDNITQEDLITKIDNENLQRSSKSNTTNNANAESNRKQNFNHMVVDKETMISSKRKSTKTSTKINTNEENKEVKKRKSVFNEDWLNVPEFRNWLIRTEHQGLVQPMCKYCQMIISNHRPNIQRHAKTAKHQGLMKAQSSTPSVKKAMAKNDPVEDMARRGEIKIAGLLATKNLPFSLSDTLVPLFADVCSDSKNAKKMSMGRTKATAVVTQVIGSHYENKLNDTLKEEGNYFSLIMDETTDQSAKKQCAVTAICFLENKLTTNFLTMIEVPSGTPKKLFGVLIETLQQKNIPLNNLVGFSSDTTNYMVGEHNSVFSHLKEAVPHVICVKCSCHMIHLTASAACLNLPRSVEDMLRNIAAHFSRSHGRQKKLQDFQQFFEIDVHKILSPATTRWLSLKQCVDRVLEQYLALEEYFKKEVSEDPSRITESILAAFGNKFTKLYLEFMSYSLEMLNDFNVLFQSQTPLLHRLKPEIEKLIKTLASNYLKFSYCKQTKALNINPSNPRNFVELDKVYVGILAQATLTEIKPSIKNENEKKKFDIKVENYKKDCLSFYIEVISQIKKRFDFSDSIFDTLKILEPAEAKLYEKKDLTEIIERFPNVRTSIVETDLQKEWRDHAMLNHDLLGLDSTLEPLDYWTKVFKLQNGIGETRFPNLQKVIRLLLVLPFSNASVERVFSKLKRTKTESRNKLNTETITALVHASNGIERQGGILKFEPTNNLISKKICNNITNNN